MKPTPAKPDIMKPLVWLLFLIALAMTALTITSCSIGPDYSPDVTAHAASWGTAPVYSAAGVMLAPGGAPQHRSTMLHK